MKILLRSFSSVSHNMIRRNTDKFVMHKDWTIKVLVKSNYNYGFKRMNRNDFRENENKILFLLARPLRPLPPPGPLKK